MDTYIISKKINFVQIIIISSYMISDTVLMPLLHFSRGLIFMTQIVGTIMLWLRSGGQHSLQRQAAWLMTYLLLLSTFNFYVYFIDNFLGNNMREVIDLLQSTSIPVFLFLLISLTHPPKPSLTVIAMNYLPYIIFVIGYILTRSVRLYTVAIYLIIVHCLGILVYGVMAVKQYNRKLLMTCSNTERLDLRWLTYILSLFFAIFAVWLISTVRSSAFTSILYNLLCSAIFFMLCFFIARQENMTNILDFKEPIMTQMESIEELGKDYQFEERFEELFRQHKIHLNTDLTIIDLAAALNTNRTYISNYINQKLNTTYYLYVNSWRLEQAIELLLNTQLPLDDVALKSGFNSRSSFRRNFLKQYGCTPGEFRKNNGKEL